MKGMRAQMSKAKIIRFAIMAVLLTPFLARAQTSVSAGPKGLASFSYNGVSYLGGGQSCSALSVLLRQGGQNRSGQVQLVNSQVNYGPGVVSILRMYRWGTLKCVYSAAADYVRANVTIKNATSAALASVRVIVVSLKTPDGQTSRMPGSDDNLGGPDVLMVSYKGSKLFIGNQQVGRPLGLNAPIMGGSLDILINSEVAPPQAHAPVTRPIQPGGSENYWLTFRFANPADQPYVVMKDLFERWRARFPGTLNWTDRRPIGMLVLGRRGPNVPFNPLNPRYWGIADPKLDINSAQGRQVFRTRLLSLAARSVANLKRMNAQGVIVWDIEGQQYPQPQVTYVGDPRYLPPEMQNGVAQEFMKQFTGNGIRCGVTLRAQKISTPLGQQLNSNSRQIYSDDPDTVFQWLSAKAQYVQQQLGCTLFYVDSNGTTGWPLDWRIFARLQQKFPNVLFIPEQKNILYYGFTAPYCDERNNKDDCPSAQARWIFPNAFSVINLSAADLAAGRNPAKMDPSERAIGGDVLMTQVWFNDPHIPFIIDTEQRVSVVRRRHRF